MGRGKDKNQLKYKITDTIEIAGGNQSNRSLRKQDRGKTSSEETETNSGLLSVASIREETLCSASRCVLPVGLPGPVDLENHT